MGAWEGGGPKSGALKRKVTDFTCKKDNHAKQFHSITVISNLLVRGEQFQLFENPNNIYM